MSTDGLPSAARRPAGHHWRGRWARPAPRRRDGHTRRQARRARGRRDRRRIQPRWKPPRLGRSRGHRPDLGRGRTRRWPPSAGTTAPSIDWRSARTAGRSRPRRAIGPCASVTRRRRRDRGTQARRVGLRRDVSSYGSRLAAACVDHTIRLWDMADVRGSRRIIPATRPMSMPSCSALTEPVLFQARATTRSASGMRRPPRAKAVPWRGEALRFGTRLRSVAKIRSVNCWKARGPII